MKIAIYNPFFGGSYAETELTQRIVLACQNLQWQVTETGFSSEIRAFSPDFVLVFHFSAPKLTGFPSYGCMWNPPDFFAMYDRAKDKKGEALRNILSYDAYLTSSSLMNSWIEHNLKTTNKIHFVAPFYPSCNQTSYLPPNLDSPKLMYVGTNWDGTRFKKLFTKLDTSKYLRVYGNKKGWSYLKNSYQGVLPFDGVSVINTLHEAGIGLCLHREEHCQASIPSMRIFEIAASGAIAICGEHPFIREAFGDCVFYLSNSPSHIVQSEEILDRIEWIQAHPKVALEMSRAAHEIFVSKYSLEKLLVGIVPFHQELAQRKGFRSAVTSKLTPAEKQVQVLVRVGGRGLEMIKRSLDSIAYQSYQNISVIIVQYQEISGLEFFLESYKERMPIQVIKSNPTGFRSTQLYEGIKVLDSDYFAILDDDEVIHPNHVSTLVSILEKHNEYDIAYSGSICVCDSEENDDKISTSEGSSLRYFSEFDIRKIVNFEDFIAANSFIAKSTCVKKVFYEDPKLILSDTLYLILGLCQEYRFRFSYEVTCEFYRKRSLVDHVSLIEKERLLNIFWDKQFLYNTPESSALESRIFSKLRDLKIQKTFPRNLTRKSNTSPFYTFLRSQYLKYSGGGLENSSPNLISRLLIRLRTYFLR